jgi:hypothetical protein
MNQDRIAHGQTLCPFFPQKKNRRGNPHPGGFHIPMFSTENILPSRTTMLIQKNSLGFLSQPKTLVKKILNRNKGRHSFPGDVFFPNIYKKRLLKI